MKYSSKAVANYFLDLAEKNNRSLSPMELLKLVYFAHGWSLALRDQPLIKDQIQAWDFGPVIPNLYHEIKKYGSGSIEEKITEFAPNETDFKKKKQGVLVISLDKTVEPEIEEDDQEVKNLLDRTWEVYNELDAFQMSRITHTQESPWTIVRNQSGGDVESIVIPDSVIKSHFLELADHG